MKNKTKLIFISAIVLICSCPAYAETRFEFTNKEKSIAHYNIAVNFAKNDQFEKAVEAFNMAVILDPANFQAFYNLGVAYSKLNKFDKAVSSYKKAIELNPDDPNNYYNVGVCLSSLNKTDEAKSYFITALNKNPNFIEARANLAMIYLENNDKINFNKQLAILQQQDQKTAEMVKRAANPIDTK